jgi:hypothetical protein
MNKPVDELWADYKAKTTAADQARAVYDLLEASEAPNHTALAAAQSLLVDADIAEDEARAAYESQADLQ